MLARLSFRQKIYGGTESSDYIETQTGINGKEG